MNGWPLTPLARGFREKDCRSTEGSEELLGLTRERGVVRRSEMEQRASVSNTYVGYKLVAEGDLVVNKMQAWNGVLGRSPFDGMTSPDYTVLESNGLWDVGFVAFMLRTPHFIAEMAKRSKGIGTGFLRLYTPDLLSIKVPCPPVDEQLAIMEHLDAETARVDALIDRKQRFIDLLLEKRTTLITHAVTKGLDPHSAMKDSGIEWTGQIAQGFRVVALKHLLLQIVDTEHKTAPFYDDGTYLVCRTTNVRDGSLRLQGAKYTDLQGYTEWTQRAVPEPGDIVFTREAPAGEACIVPEANALCLGQRTVLFKVDRSRLDSRFAIYSLYGGPARQYINLLSQGSTVAHFNMADIGTIPMTVPSLDEQRRIADFLDAQTGRLEELVSRTRKSVDLLREYRTALISAAVTGQIDIPGTETTEEVA